jgi:NAD+ diphosphatase
MLQDIDPVVYNNEFSTITPTQNDKFLFYRGKTVLAKVENNRISTLSFKELQKIKPNFSLDALLAVSPNQAKSDATTLKSQFSCIYAFTVGKDRYFLISLDNVTVDILLKESHASFISLSDLVEYFPKYIRYALTVGYHYWAWYESAQFCGKCGTKNIHDSQERMMRCPQCGNMVFPKISPAVIVGITREDGKVLITRYAGRPNAKPALVAGYCEIGEPVEKTIRREVLEEVGLRVKNFRYYKSQPWPDSGSLLLGFFCELDGSSEITLDETELAMAEWVDRDQLPENNDHSLTREMMSILRENGELDYRKI